MLLQLLVISAVAMVTVVTSTFCPSLAPFHSNYDYALVDHVIQTLPLFKPDCMSACQETLTCFSINIYKLQNSSWMCDLNRSNKKQAPASLVARTGYEYAEPMSIRYCVKGDCPLKDALPKNKFMFNSSIFEFFVGRKNWSDARQHCQGLGGDLASFSSETEPTFLFETLLRSFVLSAIKMLYMDGEDIGLSLFGGAKLEVKDNRPSLLLQKNTNGYATIPRFDFYTTDLTFGVWVNLIGGDKMYILNDEGDSSRSVRLYIDKVRPRIELEYLSGGDNVNANREISLNMWYHIAFTWNRGLRQYRWYIDGALDREEGQGESDPNLEPTTEPNFLIGKRYGSSTDGDFWISDWALLSQTLSENEISLLKDGRASEGAWIGLNDVATENQLKWSDGNPLTYQPNTDLSNTEEKDCGSVKGKSTDQKWIMNLCAKQLPFICEFSGV